MSISGSVQMRGNPMSGPTAIVLHSPPLHVLGPSRFVNRLCLVMECITLRDSPMAGAFLFLTTGAVNHLLLRNACIRSNGHELPEISRHKHTHKRPNNRYAKDHGPLAPSRFHGTRLVPSHKRQLSIPEGN